MLQSNLKLHSSIKSKWSTDIRLSGRQAFARFFDQSEVFRLKECTVFKVPNNVGHTRVGITIKCRCSSVQRTAIKRTIRESLRSKFDVLGAYDFNVLIQAHRLISYQYLFNLRKSLSSELIKKIEKK